MLLLFLLAMPICSALGGCVDSDGSCSGDPPGGGSDEEATEEQVLLSIRRVAGTQRIADSRKVAPEADATAGTNLKINYTYSYHTDCYGNGSGRGYECPEGTWCQVESRENWYPWDVSYMNHGRCLPYTPLYGACEAAFEGETAFPRKADGTFFSRPVHCGPEGEVVCSGEDFSKVLPSMCVRRRDPAAGCMSSKPFCAGRPVGQGRTPEVQLSFGECPPEDKDFCVCPKGSGGAESSCHKSSVVDRVKLEQCGSIFNSFNGPNFGFLFQGMGLKKTGQGLPNDNNIEAGSWAMVHKKKLLHGRNSDLANSILEKLWPFPLCKESNTKECTEFPLPVTLRDSDGGLLGNYTDGSIASFIPEKGSGVTDYHCTWMILHTLSFNGPPVLTASEVEAFGELVMYLSGQFDCKVCRSHFVKIIEMYGLPTGNVRENYARWLWRAHNIANEHTYATHSPSSRQILESNGKWSPKDRRSADWASPSYKHPWFMTFSDALALWSDVPGTKS